MAGPPVGSVALAGVTASTVPIAAAPAQATGGAIQGPPVTHDEQITFQEWSSYPDWRAGIHRGTAAIPGVRTGITIQDPIGRDDYTDPHTGLTRAWEYATWTSPLTRVGFDARELVASWNAETPSGTWIRSSCRAPTTRASRPRGTCWAAGPPATGTSSAPA